MAAVAADATTGPAKEIGEQQAMEQWTKLQQLRGKDAAKAQTALAEEVRPLLEGKVLDQMHNGTSQLRDFVLRRIPRFEIPARREEWDKQVEALRRDVLSNVIYRGIPKEVIDQAPKVHWGETIDTGKGYVIRKLAFEGYPGLWIPALLYEPKGLKEKVPAVLNPMGHFPAGKASEFQQIRCINLAKRGMLALSPDWVGYGQLYVPKEVEHNELCHVELSGVSGAGVLYLVAKRSLDVLLAHPHADPERIAVTGVSGGGWQTLLLSALDLRVKLAVPNAGHVDLATHTLKNMAGDKEQNPFDLGRYGDYVHLTALLFPRPALLIYNSKDPFISCKSGVKQIYEPVLSLYKKWGNPNEFQLHVNVVPGTHNYDQDNREAFYRFLNRHFLSEKDRIDKEIPSKGEILKAEQLSIKSDEPLLPGISPWYFLAEQLQKNLPDMSSSSERGSKQWAAELRDRLRKTLRIDILGVVEASRKPVISGKWYTGDQVTFTVGEDWHVPAVEFTPPKPRGTVISLTDWGKHPRYNPVQSFLLRGRHRVVCLDLPFCGELNTEGHGTFKGWNNSQLTQVFDAVGKPPLGVRVSIILAVRDFLAAQYPGQPVCIYAKGHEVPMATLLTAALSPEGGRVILGSPPTSLKELSVKRIAYVRYPTLFCFGLLRDVDIDTLKLLAKDSIVDMSALERY